jgi:hypothetical protein
LAIAAQIAVAPSRFCRRGGRFFRRESAHESFGPFFTGIVVQLVAAMFQFMRIILIPPK